VLPFNKQVINVKQKILLYLYLIIVLIALIAMIVSSVNYAEMYRAISNFRVIVKDFYYNIDFVNKILQIDMNITLIHNSSFSGFTTHSLIFSLYYNNVSEPLAEGTIWLEKKPLAPYSNITENRELNINTQTEQVAEEFVNSYQQGEDISWTFSSTVRVFVFESDFPIEINPPPFSFSK